VEADRNLEKPPSKPVTDLLRAWRLGEPRALDRLMPLVHNELHGLAQRYMRSERPDHTLQATALVNEAYLRLVDSDVEWQDRAHFFAVAAQVMRRILVDHARARRRGKRGGGAEKIALEQTVVVSPERSQDLVALDDALNALAALDERKARVVEFHYFGGLTYQETGEMLGISPATVHRELRLAKAWLYDQLQ
jgi:RNA polymerase sigma factor (TIGR02999 family)